jgi:magnesium-transporting ATPase (P-type)
MAFSIDKLISDNLLIKNIEALEVSGSVVDVLTGKTSTLTKGNLEVKLIHAGMDMHQETNPELHVSLSNLITQAIILNTDARMEMDDKTHHYIPVGNSVEVGLLKYLITQGV